MLKHNIGFLLIIIMMMPACTPDKEKDLYGAYIAKYPFATEKVTLNADGTYIQEVSIKGDPKTLTHKGRWRYEPSDKYVELENALDVTEPSGGLRKNYSIPFNGLVLMKVRRVFPSIRLGTAYEDIDFKKVK